MLHPLVKAFIVRIKLLLLRELFAADEIIFDAMHRIEVLVVSNVVGEACMRDLITSIG